MSEEPSARSGSPSVSLSYVVICWHSMTCPLSHCFGLAIVMRAHNAHATVQALRALAFDVKLFAPDGAVCAQLAEMRKCLADIAPLLDAKCDPGKHMAAFATRMADLLDTAVLWAQPLVAGLGC